MKAKRKDPLSVSLGSILIVEDEADLRDLLHYNLTREGFEVRSVASGEEALHRVRGEPPDLVLLDVMLPELDGMEVCRLMRRMAVMSTVPIIMLTAKGEEADVVRGLELGADDYVVKPFRVRELMARIKANLRRPAPAVAGASSGAGSDDGGEYDPGQEVIDRGAIVIDQPKHEVRVEGRPVTLTATEFRLLTLLAGRPGRVFTRSQIIQAVHGGMAAVTDRSVDVQVVTLRRKLGEQAEVVETVRGVGYRFRE
ncbi:MAG: response regulator transcription factor [Phycisphaeraceae bacterium]|nr:response regulator transcription factor [Phycisphaeraceae bacterium]